MRVTGVVTLDDVVGDALATVVRRRFPVESAIVLGDAGHLERAGRRPGHSRDVDAERGRDVAAVVLDSQSVLASVALGDLLDEDDEVFVKDRVLVADRFDDFAPVFRQRHVHRLVAREVDLDLGVVSFGQVEVARQTVDPWRVADLETGLAAHRPANVAGLAAVVAFVHLPQFGDDQFNRPPVTISRPFFIQRLRGQGIPDASHSKTTLRPIGTPWLTSGRTNCGFSPPVNLRTLTADAQVLRSLLPAALTAKTRNSSCPFVRLMAVKSQLTTL